jgi:hypothetical protein
MDIYSSERVESKACVNDTLFMLLCYLHEVFFQRKMLLMFRRRSKICSMLFI